MWGRNLPYVHLFQAQTGGLCGIAEDGRACRGPLEGVFPQEEGPGNLAAATKPWMCRGRGSAETRAAGSQKRGFPSPPGRRAERTAVLKMHLEAGLELLGSKSGLDSSGRAHGAQVHETLRAGDALGPIRPPARTLLFAWTEGPRGRRLRTDRRPPSARRPGPSSPRSKLRHPSCVPPAAPGLSHCGRLLLPADSRPF